MIWEEMLRDKYSAGKAEGKAEGMSIAILELLEEIGTVPEEMRTKILSVSDMELLKKWHKQAARAESIEQFAENIR